MKRTIAATAGLLVLLSALPHAHRLDEYLQAARLSLKRTSIALELDLEPGAREAANIIVLIDRDADNAISPLEAESYGHAVLKDVLIELDDRLVAMTLTQVEIPSIDEMRHGIGTIQLRASGKVEWALGTRPHLHFRNNHRADSSVYLVNALAPADDDVQVVSQTRDVRQQDVRIDYSVARNWPARVYWPVLAVVAVFLAFRRASRSVDLQSELR